jgi:UDP-N-acetylmuramate: L-alanyl-gamma-D-glutamyl-meso-diaminopimelate ligase
MGSLAALGIPVCEGYRGENLDWDPELVIIGNAIHRSNLESQRVEEQGLDRASFPEAVARFFLRERHSLVISGTHGKTTTTALTAWILHHAGRDPGALVGGVMRNFDATALSGQGPDFAIEGDEYDSAWFDKGAKFFHYLPQTAILTSLEFDHADIFPDLDAIRATFQRFVDLIPKDGLLVACADSSEVLAVANRCRGRLVTYGVEAEAEWQGEILDAADGWMRFTVQARGRDWGPYKSPLVGRHNLANTLAIMAAVEPLGVDPDKVGAALLEFKGIKRRQEVRGEVGGVSVLDDFAHHPTAVRETISSVRMSWPGRRLWAIFEPRTNTNRTNVFQDVYPDAFAAVGVSDEVIIAAVEHPERVADPADRFSPERLVRDLGDLDIRARYLGDVETIVTTVVAEARPGDVVLVMSNGSFDGIHEKLLAALAGGWT